MEVNVFQPGSLQEALGILAENKDNKLKILAGGTDLLLELDRLKKKNINLMDITKINELRSIKKDEGNIRIGSLATFNQIIENELIDTYLSSLANAAGKVGSVQIRNRATLGGNIANSSPAADSLPVLTSLSAQLKISSQNNDRLVPVNDIITGFYENNLASDEMITEIIIPETDDSHILYFDKVGSRKSVTIARINMGAKIKIENNLIKEAIISFGALNKKPIRAENVEKYIIGKKIDEINKSEFNQELKAVVDKAIPGRYSQQYKRNAICGLGNNLRQKLEYMSLKENSYE